ncbi:hypothetical protein GCM10020000_12970 [Streptomyces olivoverticillatus]
MTEQPVPVAGLRERTQLPRHRLEGSGGVAVPGQAQRYRVAVGQRADRTRQGLARFTVTVTTRIDDDVDVHALRSGPAGQRPSERAQQQVLRVRIVEQHTGQVG